MNRKSFFKKLLALGVGAVCVTTGAMFAACNKDNKKSNGEENNPPAPNHVHQWSTGTSADAWGKDATNHWRLCLAEGHGTQGGASAEGYGAHSYTGNVCDTCGYEKTSQVDPGQQDPPSTTHQNVVVDIAKISVNSSLAAGELVSGSGVSTTSALAVAASGGKTITYNGEDITSVNRLNMNGEVTYNADGTVTKGLKIVTEAAAKVLIYAHSTSGGKEAGVKMLNSTGAQVGTNYNLGYPEGNFVGVAVFDVAAAGTYYFGAASSNSIGVFYVAVVYGEFNETSTEVPAVAADCENAGNPKYYKTNYGRFYTADGTTLVTAKSQIVIAASGHDYTGVNVTVDSANLPTATAAGSATAACQRTDCQHVETIVLPKLDNRSYTRTETGAASGNYVYTYNDATTGLTVTFETVQVEEEAVKSAYKVVLNAKTVESPDGYVTSGWEVSTAKTGISVTIDGTEYTTGAKLDSTGSVTIVLTESATVTFYTYCTSASQTLAITGTDTDTVSLNAISGATNGHSGTTTKTLGAGTYTVKRGGSKEIDILYVVITPAQS